MSATEVNLSRGRSSPPRAISALSMACHPAASTTSGHRLRTSLSSAAGLPAGFGQQAGVVVVDQVLHGLQRARLVGADEAGRSALDPARDVAAAHRRAGLRVDDPAAVVRHHRCGLVERQIANRLAAVADRRQHQPGVEPARLLGAGDRELDTGRPGRRRRRGAASGGRPAGSAAASGAPTRRRAWLRISSLLRVSGSSTVGQVGLHQVVVGGVEHHLARRGQPDEFGQRERGLRGPAAGGDHHLGTFELPQRGQRVVGDVGARQRIRIGRSGSGRRRVRRCRCRRSPPAHGPDRLADR